VIKLYGPVRSSAGRCYLCLEEIGIPYESVNINLMEKEHLGAKFLEINPNGKVPALVDGDVTLFESMAINFYLAEKYKPELMGKNLAERAKVYQWSFWAISELQSPMIQLLIQKVFVPEARRDQKIIEESLEVIPKYLEVLDKSLGGQKYLASNEYTLADLNMYSVVSIANAIQIDLNPYKNITGWLNILSERESHKKYLSMRK